MITSMKIKRNRSDNQVSGRQHIKYSVQLKLPGHSVSFFCRVFCGRRITLSVIHSSYSSKHYPIHQLLEAIIISGNEVPQHKVAQQKRVQQTAAEIEVVRI